MDFFEYACKEASEYFRSCGYPGIDCAGKVPGGYVFRADLGPKYDGVEFFTSDPYLFVFEDDMKACRIPVSSQKHKFLMKNMVQVDVPKEYLSNRVSGVA